MSERPTLEEAYVHRLDRVLLSLSSVGSPDEVLDATEGAFPTLVADRCATRPVHDDVRRVLASLADPPPAAAAREPHLLDYEWYFTPPTARAVAHRALAAGDRVLCLGTPTVAAAVAAWRGTAILVDRNPAVLHEVTSTHPAVEPVEADLSIATDAPRASVAVIDPPWYDDHLRRWLDIATASVGTGGRVLAPLIQDLVRPSAADERRRLVDDACRVGAVEIVRRALRYETPRFEYEAMRAGGLRLSRPWRTADLLVLTVLDPVPVARQPPDVEDEWVTYGVGPQTVKVRKGTTRRAHGPAGELAPLPGSHGFVFDSVSRRDARRALVDVWTSRNRVATAADLGLVHRAFRLLDAGAGLPDLERRLPHWTPAATTAMARLLAEDDGSHVAAPIP